MKMIRLSDGCWVASSEIAEVKVNDYADSITVRTKNGIGHHYPKGYGESTYTTADRLVAEINAAEALDAE